MSRSYWWCPRCQITCDPRRVTYEEYHDSCGTQVQTRTESELLTLQDQAKRIAALEAELGAAKHQTERLREALEDLTRQFAYPVNGPCLITGGLSALKSAFEALGWKDPHEVPCKCDENGCFEFATCGWPDGDIYRRTCLCHMKHEALEAAPPTEEEK